MNSIELFFSTARRNSPEKAAAWIDKAEEALAPVVDNFESVRKELQQDPLLSDKGKREKVRELGRAQRPAGSTKHEAPYRDRHEDTQTLVDRRARRQVQPRQAGKTGCGHDRGCHARLEETDEHLSQVAASDPPDEDRVQQHQL